MSEKSREELQQELDHAVCRIKELEAATSELMRVKDALRESEARYRTAFEYTGTAMIVVNPDTTISMGNHKLEEFTGYNQDDIARGRKWTEVVVPEDLERLMSYHNSRRTSPDLAPSEYELRLRDQHGEVHTMLANVTMLPDSDKSLVSLFDITNLKKIELALRESERKYRDLFENANDIIFTVDLEGFFISANYVALKTYGYSSEEMFKTRFYDIIDPAYIPVVISKLSDKLSLHSKSHTYELLTRTRSGDPVWVEVSTRLIRERDCTIGIQGIARDITERKRQEEKLQESQRRFKETSEMLPGIICEMDLSLKLTYVNRIGLTTFGYTDKEFEQGVFVSDLIPDAFVEKFSTTVSSILKGEPGAPSVYSLYKKDRSLIHVILNSAPIFKDDQVVGIRTCFFDICDRINAEEKLRLSEERFRSIYSESPIGIALFSPDGHIFDMNESFKLMFSERGNTSVQIELFSKLELTKKERADLQQGNGINRETEEFTGAGVDENRCARYLDWYITPMGISESGPSVYLAQVQDITERKRASEAKLKKEREATRRAEELVAGLKRQLREKSSFQNMVSRSPKMKQIFESIPEIAQVSATVLISGDSGTGKELVARSLHELSNRKSKPFVAINCSALPDTLLESELFGYKAGAFTDAKKDKPGKFALAEGGTIFLDEIGDISAAMQVKLLRVLQERVYEPLGGTAPVKSNVRVIVATNKDLSAMVAEGSFREDLFYRINVVTIKLPPLRDRRCDIPLLADYFIERFDAQYGKEIRGITREAMEALLMYDFPGNIRELENMIEHAFIFCKTPTIEIKHLPSVLNNNADVSVEKNLSGIKSFDELERMYIKNVLEQSGGNRAIAAQRLGIHKATLFRKLKNLGI